MEDFVPKIRVNGSLLPQYNGKGVVLVGKILNVSILISLYFFHNGFE